jgi:hypothetical protein
MTQLAVPTEVEDCSASWLECALSVATGSLESRTVERIGGDAGILGRLFRLRLSWSRAVDAAPHSVVVKMTVNQPEDLVLLRPAFEREMNFYDQLAPVAGVRTPRVYWSGMDADTGAAAIVMEDLGGGTIYETGTAPVAAIESITRAIAPLHARWFNHPRLASFSWLMDSTVVQRQFGPRLRHVLPLVRGWYEEHAPGLLPLVELMPDAIDRGLFANPGCLTLAHGDLGLKNTAFLSGEVVLFDWQLAGRRNPGWDIGELVKDAFGPLEPGPLADRLLAVHYEALRSAGLSDITPAELREGFAQRMLTGIFAPAISLGVPDASPGRQDNARRWAYVATALLDEYSLERRIREAL